MIVYLTPWLLFIFGMAFRALGGSFFGIVVLIVLAMAAHTVLVHGIADISQLILLGHALGRFAFDFSGFVVAFKARLDFVAFL